MTDTGQVPGEGQPENAGGHPGQPQPAAAPSPADAGPTELPGMVTPPGEYPYLDQADGVVEDDDLLLMPGAQGAWSEQPAAQPYPQPQDTAQGVPFDATAQAASGFEPLPAEAGDHESGGRDSGSVDLSAVRVPQPAGPQQPERARAAAPQQPDPARAGAPARRPLHMGPPVPDPTSGVVRSLADRGPADSPARHAGPPAGGPEYFDAPAEAPQGAEGVPGAQPAADLPYEQAAGEATPDRQTVPAPAYGEQQPYGDPSYGGQLSAEQTYGAAGQGPLPGPQLGEIPSQMPPWGEAPAPAAPVAEAAPAAGAALVADAAQVAETAPAAETAAAAEAPAPAAEAAPQDTALPAEQPQPMPQPLPAEDAAATVDAPAPATDAVETGPAPDAATAQDAPAQQAPAEAPAEAPAQPQDAAPQDAAPQGTVDAAAPATVPAEAAGPQEATAVDADTEPVPAPDTPVQGGTADGLQQPDGEQPAADQATAAAETPAPAETVAAEAAAPAAVVPEAAAQPAPEQPAAPADAAPAPQDAQAPAPQDADQSSPAVEAETAPADAADQAAQPAAEDRAASEETAPAETAAPADGAAAAEAPAPTAEAAPAPVAAPQGPVALPVPDAADTPVEQTVIEPPEAQQPADGQPQPGAAVDAAAQQTAEAPAPEPEPRTAAAPADEQPVTAGQDLPAEPAAAADPSTDAAPPADDAPADDTAAAPAQTVAADDPAATGAEPVIVQIPAQATGDQSEDRAAAPAPADGTVPQPGPADGDHPAAAEPDAGAPQQQDATELVQLGEDAEDDEQPHAAQQPAEDLAADDPAGLPGTTAAAGYDDSERAAVHRVMRERRDIRNGFRSDPIPNEVLLRVLEAAHTAPSVGHSQPWDFVVIRSAETREKMHQLAMQQREAYAKSLPKARAKQFRELKIEAILETPVNIVVTADPTRGGRHTLGRHTQPQMAPYSSALAVENLWLAARAEGLGVGWVSFFDEREMVRELDLPEHLEVVAYLCVGYVDEFPEEPELLQAGWSKRRPLSWVVHEETYGRRALPGESPHDLLQETLQGIRPLDAKALGEAWERQKRMTKPAGALGMLEIISAQLCGLSRKCPPPIPEPAAVAIFAGDHGVHAQGVTPWPQEVTGQMVANFLGGGAVCNAFANQVGAEVCVVDVGVASELPATPGLLPRKVRAGTADFTVGPAMTQEEVLKAIEVGIETARDLVAAGNKALLTGEMGIANTTTSAALIAVYTGVDPVEVTGRGTGINDETHARKVDVVRRALELHQPDPADPIGVLTAIGGLEHAAMVGLILGGASLRTPVILDGVSAGAAALVARAIAPEALAACIAGHRSAEPGHVAALNKLGLRPLVDLDLRLGEGTGALLALPVVQSAARAMHEVATFDSAGVTEKS
ncbi:nicotinate-nucleotide--dimethylbenzimidazole phosphoribosyltransferase [Streptomyces lydicus]|uniref:nicotinate-nucleotide--dimethylbenzimidazole phosphoribosyltransferase n=1 Tax=Streptomyces lydicus TaxID=47763 RepID=UPI0036FE7892